MRKAYILMAGLIVGLLAVFGMSACSTRHSAYYDTICVDPLSQIRMPDFYCLVGNPYYHSSWIYYVPLGYSAPGYNVHVTNYNTHNYQRPTNATIHTGGVSSTGGKATKYKTGNVVVKPPKQQAPPPDKINKNKNAPGYKPKNGGGYKAPKVGGGYKPKGR